MKNLNFKALPSTTFGMYYVYLLKSLNFDQIYIGSTIDLRKRLKEHNQGKSISTKRYIPWKLAYYEAFEREKLARLREKSLKYNGNAMRELRKRIFLSESGAGFTLIEILVSMTIVGFLFSFGYASFRDFSRRQALAGVVKQVQGDLRLAQQKALSGEKPANVACTNPGNTLNAYNFFRSSASAYTIQADCSGSPTAVLVKTVNLPTGITIALSGVTPLNTIKFKVLGNGTNGTPATITLTQAGVPNPQFIIVTAGGEIR